MASRVTNWGAAVGGVVGLVAVFFPEVRQWMVAHGLLGWVAATAAIVLLPVISSIEMHVRVRAVSDAKDHGLVMERLAGWSLASEFFTYIVEHADHNHFSASAAHQIEDRVRAWSLDQRSISHRKLRGSWTSVDLAARAYSEAILENMWTWDTGPRTKPDPKFLRVPVEWQSTDLGRYDAAHKLLSERRSALVKALRDLFKVLHDVAPL
jgi:hypothetical protein